MARFRSISILVACLGAIALAPSGAARAAVFSEVLFNSTFLQPGGPGTAGAIAPPYIELNNLPADHAIDLVIVNADSSPVRHGMVLQVFTLPVGTATRVLAQGTFPLAALETPNAAVVQPLPAGVTFDLSPTLPRSLLLFDGVTGLSVSQLISHQSGKLAGKPLLDALTFGTVATTHAGETVWNFAGATAAARPRAAENDPGESWVWGVPAATGVLGDTSYRLSPGLENRVQPVPEPAAASLLVTVSSILVFRRR